jgi:hypothetical protein
LYFLMIRFQAVATLFQENKLARLLKFASLHPVIIACQVIGGACCLIQRPPGDHTERLLEAVALCSGVPEETTEKYGQPKQSTEAELRVARCLPRLTQKMLAKAYSDFEVVCVLWNKSPFLIARHLSKRSFLVSVNEPACKR